MKKFTFFHTTLTLLLCFVLFGNKSQAQNLVLDHQEFEALKAFYDNLGDPNWGTKVNWPTPGNWPTTATAAQMDTWHGVRVVNGDVDGIIMTTNNLVGS